MSETETVAARKRRRRRAAGDGAAADAVRLLAESTSLLFAADVTVTPGELLAVARTAERGVGESHSPCACRRCGSALVAAEGRAKGAEAFRRFEWVAAFFLEELPSWGGIRRAAAEEALARRLGV